MWVGVPYDRSRIDLELGADRFARPRTPPPAPVVGAENVVASSDRRAPGGLGLADRAAPCPRSQAQQRAPWLSDAHLLGRGRRRVSSPDERRSRARAAAGGSLAPVLVVAELPHERHRVLASPAAISAARPAPAVGVHHFLVDDRQRAHRG